MTLNPTVIAYEPPLSPAEKATEFWALGDKLLFEGVKGFAFEHKGLIYIPLIVAEREGSGQVGKFLDRLSQRCCVVGVTSERLEGMLKRRSFHCRIEPDPFERKMKMDVWQRGA